MDGENNNYDINIYRLIWKGDNTNGALFAPINPMKIENVVFDITHKGGTTFSYLGGSNNCSMMIENCITIGSFVMVGYNISDVKLKNCYGNFREGLYMGSKWNYMTNYITTNVKVDMQTYQITESESIWKNKGTGKNPDGTPANLGVYGGTYSWEK